MNYNSLLNKLFCMAVWALLGTMLCAQEVLLPLQRQVVAAPKWGMPLVLPFFDDFSSPDITSAQWNLGGTLVNNGYAPLPPTIGMATLDAFDAEGRLYPNELGQKYSGDTLTSAVLRLDSAFVPYSRPLSVDDSVYLSFFYLPGGGYGNRWQGVGDVPEEGDSLVLEFYDASADTWRWMWSSAGVMADTLFARTGSYWQFCNVLIDDPAFFSDGFRFRFRNYCSLDVNTKKGFLSNSDQWNIDYVYLNAGRTRTDSTLRDVAFVQPPQSMLSHYQAMPFVQYRPSEMRSELDLMITNRFSNELATNYGYQIFDDRGQEVFTYDGGFENAPVYWDSMSYQQASPHAHPSLGWSVPAGMTEPTAYTIVHGLREGVSGDAYPQNDTIRFRQVFDNYYAYDDGTSENGYGISSTYPRVKLACRFDLNQEDTLTAIQLYFNRTYREQNADIRFLLTVWDDAGGEPGSVIYQDASRRRPEFAGLNQFVRYVLEQPLVCSGTIHVGLEQTTADVINLGFDRNCDASSRIFYRAGTEWQTTILQGALMLRPYFGAKATVGISSVGASFRVSVQHSRITVCQDGHAAVAIYDSMGRQVFAALGSAQVQTPALPQGLYLVKVGSLPAQKVMIL